MAGKPAKDDTGVSEDAPDWFHVPAVPVLENMRPVFNPHAKESRRWDRSDTATSDDAPTFMRTNSFVPTRGQAFYAHGDYVIGQHSPRSRVQNSLIAYMVDGPAGLEGKRAVTEAIIAREVEPLLAGPGGSRHLRAAHSQAVRLLRSDRAALMPSCSRALTADGTRPSQGLGGAKGTDLSGRPATAWRSSRPRPSRPAPPTSVAYVAAVKARAQEVADVRSVGRGGAPRAVPGQVPFDPVVHGIGGTAPTAMGRRLAKLAERQLGR